MELIGKRFTSSTNPNITGIISSGPIVLRDQAIFIVVYDNGEVNTINACNITLWHYNPEPIID